MGVVRAVKRVEGEGGRESWMVRPVLIKITPRKSYSLLWNGRSHPSPGSFGPRSRLPTSHRSRVSCTSHDVHSDIE